MTRRILAGSILFFLVLLWVTGKMVWDESHRRAQRNAEITLLSLTRSLARTAEFLPEPDRAATLRKLWQADLSPYRHTELLLSSEPLSDGVEYVQASVATRALAEPIRMRVPVSSLDLSSEMRSWSGLSLLSFGLLVPSTLLLIWRSQQRASLDSLRLLTVGLQKAREEEATQISRDLHDDLGQTLALLKLELSRRDLPRLSELTQQALDSLRQVVRGLRPALLDQEGLYAAIEWKARELEKDSQVDVVLRLSHPEPRIEPSVRFTIYRIFQELTTNALKHAHPTKIVVTVDFTRTHLSLTVEDDGPGFPNVVTSGGLGLPGLRERVRELKGQARLESVPGARITVVLPFSESDCG